MDKVEKIKAEIERRYEYWKEKESNSHSIESEIRMSECQHLLLLFNSLQKEPVSNDLEEDSKQYALNNSPWEDCVPEVQDAFKAGAQWQKEKIIAKVCDWLADNYSKYIITNGLATVFSATIDFDTIRMIEDLKKAMEE